jgi:hypothetical protein
MDPGTDPAISGTYPTANNPTASISGVAYSNEESRAQLLCDLMAMAFACDLSRVASLRFTYDQCTMRMEAITGQTGDMHNLTHNKTAADVADGVGWHVKHFSRLVAKLRDTPDIGGKSILDSAALVLLFEGGHGFDPEGGQAKASPHSTEKMIALVAGRAGGLRMGQHIVAPDKHPAQVVLTAMNAVGVPATSLGEVSGSIVGLL